MLKDYAVAVHMFWDFLGIALCLAMLRPCQQECCWRSCITASNGVRGEIFRWHLQCPSIRNATDDIPKNWANEWQCQCSNVESLLLRGIKCNLALKCLIDLEEDWGNQGRCHGHAGSHWFWDILGMLYHDNSWHIMLFFDFIELQGC